jgi:hypothetical protein
MGAHVGLAGPGFHPRLFGFVEHQTQKLLEGGKVGLGQPWVVDRLKIADLPFAKPRNSGGYQKGVAFVAVIEGSPMAGDDDG